MDACVEFSVPAGPVLTPQQALDDPQVQAMGDLHTLDIPGSPSPAPVMGAPFALSKTPGTIRHRAPLLGEHTDEILGEIGYSEADIEALRAKNVI